MLHLDTSSNVMCILQLCFCEVRVSYSTSCKKLLWNTLLEATKSENFNYFSVVLCAIVLKHFPWRSINSFSFKIYFIEERKSCDYDKILKVQNKDLRFILQSFAKCLKKVRVYPAFNLHDNELIDKCGNYWIHVVSII